MDVNLQDRLGTGFSMAVAFICALMLVCAMCGFFRRPRAMVSFVSAYSIVASGVVYAYTLLDPWQFFSGVLIAACAWMIATTIFCATYLAASWLFGRT